MATLNIKNVPDELYARLKGRASTHRRSINSEAIVCLEESLCPRRVESSEILARVDRLRDEIKLPPLTDEFLDQAINWGRP